MEQKQEQKQGTLVKVTFIVGIAAVVFVLLAFAAPGLLWIPDLLSIAGIILAIIALVKKLEPKKSIFIGGGLSLFALILSLSGVIGYTEDFTELDINSPYVYSSHSDNTPSNINSTIKEKAHEYTKRVHNAHLKGDKATMLEINAEVAAYIETLDKDEVSLFMEFCKIYEEELTKGTSSTSSR
jgi:hypothetical protein